MSPEKFLPIPSQRQSVARWKSVGSRLSSARKDFSAAEIVYPKIFKRDPSNPLFLKSPPPYNFLKSQPPYESLQQKRRHIMQTTYQDSQTTYDSLEVKVGGDDFKTPKGPGSRLNYGKSLKVFFVLLTVLLVVVMGLAGKASYDKRNELALAQQLRSSEADTLSANGKDGKGKQSSSASRSVTASASVSPSWTPSASVTASMSRSPVSATPSRSPKSKSKKAGAVSATENGNF
eukprot:g25032.t1